MNRHPEATITPKGESEETGAQVQPPMEQTEESSLLFKELSKYYVQREFSRIFDKANYNRIQEDNVFEIGKNTIIVGVGGIGKTLTMKKLAEDVKKNYPKFSVNCINLVLMSSIFKSFKDKKLTSKHNPAQDGENIDVWNFVVDNLLDLGETEEERRLQKSLLEAHVKEEQPKIVLFLDGFDKISPLYTNQVVQIINGLKEMKVQMFVSSQLQLQEILQNLEFELNYKIEPFSERMQREFLREYWKDYLCKKVSNNEIREADIDRLHVNLYTKKFFKMCQKSVLTDTILSVPLMLNILADIYAEECVKFCIKSGREVKEFLEIDILNVYEKIFKDNCKKYSKKIFINVDDPVIVQAEERNIEKWRQIYMAIAAKKLLKLLYSEENLTDTEGTEIYERGFITGQTVGEYSFIYDTMEEFFAADWFTRKIFPNNGSINVDLFEYLLKKNAPQKEAKSKNKKDDGQKENKLDVPKGVRSFAYRFILKRLKEFRESGNETIPEEDKKRISAFIIEFFHQAWYNQESFQLAAIFDMAKMFCSKEQIQDVLKVKKLLETVPFTSSAQLELSVQIHDYYFDPEATNEVLGQRDLNKIMELTLKNTNYPLFESLYAAMKDRGIYSEDDFVTKTFDLFEKFLLKQDLKDRLFAKDLFWWFFEHCQMKQEEVLRKLNKVFEESIKNNKPKFPERHLAGYLLTSFWDLKIREETEDRNNKEGAEKEFVEGLFKNLKESKNFYRFLYAINCTTREDLLQKSVEAMREYGLDFTCYDGKSVLFHAFSDNNTFLLQNLLKLLHKSEIEAQISANVCGGTSLTQQCTKGNYLCEVILQELVNKFGSDVVGLFFTAKVKETKEVEDNLKIFSTFFRKDMKVDEEILKGLAKRLCESCNDRNQLLSIAEKVSSPEALIYIQNFLKMR
ncbi:uncharacterized protein LOC129794786 [Lutzomyia longipalpis]|uniref:uncharacterized protein LOC129794786 n=1 Tax=Lutzomyia longipalpis TaxID=7200 RepID=UPI002483C886|nr:uncharacterized protein LOC129794786 [Lutzomyia longipalpis]